MKKYIVDPDFMDQILTLSEPTSAYGSSADMISTIRAGISRDDVLAFCRRIGRTLASLAKVLPASYSLLTKRDRFDAQVTERIMQIARLYTVGLGVFGEIERLECLARYTCPTTTWSATI